MAEVAAVRVFLREVIGLGINDEGTRRAEAMIAEGLDSFQAFLDFDKADIKSMCTAIRRPGGLIEDPNDENRQIANPGLSIPAICESRLITAAYGAQVYSRIGRACTGVTLSRLRLKELKKHREAIGNHNDPDGVPALSKTFGIMKFLEMLPTFLESKIGADGIPLAYVIRETYSSSTISSHT